MCPDPLNYKHALEQACNDHDFLMEMLGELHNEVGAKLMGMRPKLHNPMTVKSNAHAIKGVCANFRCEHMQKMSKALEFLAKPYIMAISRRDKTSPDYLGEQERKRVKYLNKHHQANVARHFAVLEKEFLRYEAHIVERYSIVIVKKYVCCAKESKARVAKETERVADAKESEARVADAILATEKAADGVSADAKMATVQVTQAREQLKKGDTKMAERSLERAKRSMTSSMREAKAAKAAAAEAVAAAAAAERQGDIAAAAMKGDAADAAKVAEVATLQAKRAQAVVEEVETAVQKAA